MQRALHDALIFHGFIQSRGIENAYEKQFFDGILVRVTDFDEDWVRLPRAQVVSDPSVFPPLSAHRLPENYLCYLEPETYVFDRYNHSEGVGLIVSQMEKLLRSYKNDEDLDREVANELPSYWSPSFSCYFDESEGRCRATQYWHPNLAGKEVPEIVVSSDESHISWWMRKRNANSAKGMAGSAIVLTTDTVPVFPSAPPWPPRSMSEYLSWLKSFDPGLTERIIHHIVKINKREFVAIIVKGELASTGVVVKFTADFKRACTRARAATKGIRTLLNSKNSTVLFDRLTASQTNGTALVERSSGKKGLVGQKIAVIGCGSVGGYTAQLLFQGGAGQHGGRLDLFDSDILRVENLGRHLLGAKYLGDQKSSALRHCLLEASSDSSAKIEARGNWVLAEATWRTFDIVVDVVGNPSFSIALAHRFHRNNSSVKLIHGWIDGAGLVARSLTDVRDGVHACYRCFFRDLKGSVRFPATGSLDGSDLPAKRLYCGNLFQPYSTDAAVTAAGLIQRSALDLVSGEGADRLFKHLCLDARGREMKPQSPKALSHCPCCDQHLSTN